MSRRYLTKVNIPHITNRREEQPLSLHQDQNVSSSTDLQMTTLPILTFRALLARQIFPPGTITTVFLVQQAKWALAQARSVRVAVDR